MTTAEKSITELARYIFWRAEEDEDGGYLRKLVTNAILGAGFEDAIRSVAKEESVAARIRAATEAVMSQDNMVAIAERIRDRVLQNIEAEIYLHVTETLRNSPEYNAAIQSLATAATERAKAVKVRIDVE